MRGNADDVRDCAMREHMMTASRAPRIRAVLLRAKQKKTKKNKSKKNKRTPTLFICQKQSRDPFVFMISQQYEKAGGGRKFEYRRKNSLRANRMFGTDKRIKKIILSAPPEKQGVSSYRSIHPRNGVALYRPTYRRIANPVISCCLMAWWLTASRRSRYTKD